MEYRKQGHCVYGTEYHIVITTKYRRRIFNNNGLGQYCIVKLAEISKYYPDIRTREAKTDQDHMHFLIYIPPRFSVSRVINIIKSNTGRAVRERFPHLKDVYWGDSGIWSGGYFVSTVGLNEEQIRKYIEMQGAEDGGQAKPVLL
jgi:putative transposase